MRSIWPLLHRQVAVAPVSPYHGADAYAIHRSAPVPTRCSCGAGPAKPVNLQGLWPYWMPNPALTVAGEASAVANDPPIGTGIMILTGANMSGKSTLMRSSMAAVLLAHCGLPIPAAGGSVPRVRCCPVELCSEVWLVHAGISGCSDPVCTSKVT